MEENLQVFTHQLFRIFNMTGLALGISYAVIVLLVPKGHNLENSSPIESRQPNRFTYPFL